MWLSYCFSGIFLICAFPYPDIGSLGWIALVPLLYGIHHTSSLKAVAGYSFLTGVIFFAGSMYGIMYVTFFGYMLLVCYLSCFFVLFALMVKSMDSVAIHMPVRASIWIACMWVLIEYLRAHFLSGMGWNLLGYTQYKWRVLLQMASLTGIWGMSFLVALVNALIYHMIWEGMDTRSSMRRLLRRWIRPWCIIGIIFACVLGYGTWHIIHLDTDKNTQTLSVGIIQGNISQREKWRKELKASILAQYTKLSLCCLTDHGKESTHPILLVWPETAFPETIMTGNEPLFRQIGKLAREKGIFLLTGANGADIEGMEISYFNSAFLIDPQGELCGRYDKVHLVPFGEYIPPFLRGTFLNKSLMQGIKSFSYGQTQELLTLSSLHNDHSCVCGVLICFEDVFPELAQKWAAKGAEFLIVITNDAWFLKSSVVTQHFIKSIVRAVETGRYVVRAANTGISAVIAPSGEIKTFIQNSCGDMLEVEGYGFVSIERRSEKTFFTKYPDMGIFLCGIYLLLSIVFSRKLVYLY